MSVTSSQMLNNEEMHQLVDIARKAIKDYLAGIKQLPEPDNFPEVMRAPGACFVTLEVNQQLKGCLGCMTAQRPLVEEVYSKAQSASYQDHRFTPLAENQLSQLTIEVSVLSPLQHFDTGSEQELEIYLKKHPVGVILSDTRHSAVFLPQVWEQLPTPKTFLQHLKMKGGWSPLYWSPEIQVQLFSVQNKKEAFHPA